MNAMAAAEHDFPQPDPGEAGRPFWEGLSAGALTFQRCKACGKGWLPARSHCPHCLSDEWAREKSHGQARLISWVVYHMAYHPAFAQRLPYIVAVIQLDEGPRMISNIVQAKPESLKIDMALSLVIENESGVSVPRFVPASK
jgi:uncharacterized protein